MRAALSTAVVSVIALALAACGAVEPSDGFGGAPAPGEEQEMGPEGPGPAELPEPPDDPIDPPPSGPEMRAPNPDAADVRVTEWEEAQPLDDTTLRVTYWTGVEPCAVLSHVEVEETSESVTITVFTGRDGSTDADVACIMIAVYAGVDVELEEPIGDRELIDGAAAIG